MVATTSRRGTTVDAVDLFAGYGGASDGLRTAGVELKLAANHNRLAIETHAANFPNAEHRRADLRDTDSADYVDPADLPPATLLWASPSCKHHSLAQSKRIYKLGPQASLFDDEDGFDEVKYAQSETSRTTMLCPLRYAQRHFGAVELVLMENVVEAAKWGPNADGSTFRWWLNEWNKIGYEYKVLFLNSQFFDCPQSRDRMYIVCWKRGNKAPDLDFRPVAWCTSAQCGGREVQSVQTFKPRKPSWPLAQYGKYGSNYLYRCDRCSNVVQPAVLPAYTAIDWFDLGPTLGERAKPLADTTIDRIRSGLAKFGSTLPVVVPAKAQRGSERPVWQPLATQTAQADKGLATVAGVEPFGGSSDSDMFGFSHMPFITEFRGGGSKKSGQHAVTSPAHTVTAGGLHHGLFTPAPAMFQKINGVVGSTAWHSVSDPFNSITTRDTTGLVMLPWLEQWRKDPARTSYEMSQRIAEMTVNNPNAFEALTDSDLSEVRFRMLQPETELRKIMGFRKEYILLGSKRDKAAGLGNAVTPPVAEQLTRRCLATLGLEEDLAA